MSDLDKAFPHLPRKQESRPAVTKRADELRALRERVREMVEEVGMSVSVNTGHEEQAIATWAVALVLSDILAELRKHGDWSA